MVMLETSFARLQKILGRKISLEKLREALFDLGMELEKSEGDILSVDITAERLDMVSTHGLGRALRCYLGGKPKQYTSKKSKYEVIIEKSVSDVRPYTACAVVRGLSLDEEDINELILVQEKLHETFGRNRRKAAIGVYPLEHITFPIRFIAEHAGKIHFRPLGSSREMSAEDIIAEHPKGKLYGHLLEGKKKYPLFVDAHGKILSMPPIINSHEAGCVTTETHEVFVECSGFDFSSLCQVLNVLVALLQDMGGVIYNCRLRYRRTSEVTPKLIEEKRSIDVAFVERMTGIPLDGKKCARLLERMMHRVVRTEKKRVTFFVPPFRMDVWHDVDIADDIVRATGVNNIRYSKPFVYGEGHMLHEARFKRQLAELLVGLGFQEIFTLALTNAEDQFRKMRLDEQGCIKLGKTAEQSINMVRRWLLPEGLKALVHNRNRLYPQQVFEVEEVVIPDTSQDVLSKNAMKCCCLIAGTDADFTKIKQHLVYLLACLGIEASFVAMKQGSFLEGRCASVTVGKKELGVIGEIHPEVLTNFGLEMPTVGFEIDVDILRSLLKK